MSKKTFVRSFIASVLAVTMFYIGFAAPVQADKAPSPADLNDLEIAHVAYTADNIDIRYAHLALAKSKNPVVIEFAETMVQDHTGINTQALALLEKLNAQPQDNFLSQQLNQQADQLVEEMSALSGDEFDKKYAANELAYHQAVNALVGGTFVPNIENPEMKALFEQALVIFQAHEQKAQKMVDAVNK
jgi:putative membrane protein